MPKNMKNWTYYEGKALILVYEQRKEEYNKTRNKKHFWESILTDLEAMDILESTTTVEQVQSKWGTLYRAYKSAKDRGTGASGTKFLFMEEMDAIFHDNPLLSSPHSVMVGTCSKPQPIITTRKSLPEESTAKHQQTQPKRKSMVEIKQQYYEDKIDEKRKTREFMEQYLDEKEKNKRQRHMELVEALQNRNM